MAGVFCHGFLPYETTVLMSYSALLRTRAGPRQNLQYGVLFFGSFVCFVHQLCIGSVDSAVRNAYIGIKYGINQMMLNE